MSEGGKRIGVHSSRFNKTEQLSQEEINLSREIAMTMMVNINLNKESQVKLWAEWVNRSGLLENLILKVDQNKPDMESWTGDSTSNWFNCLVQFGRTRYFANKDKIKRKIT